MHKSFFINETGIHNRQGAMYRDYADGRLSHFNMVENLLVDDVIAICLETPTARGDKYNAHILMDIKRRFKEIGLHDDNILVSMVLVIYNFGFIQGGKAVRDKRKRKTAEKERAVSGDGVERMFDNKEILGAIEGRYSRERDNLLSKDKRFIEAEAHIEAMIKFNLIDIDKLQEHYTDLIAESNEISYYMGVSEGAKLIISLISGNCVRDVMNAWGTYTEDKRIIETNINSHYSNIKRGIKQPRKD